MNIIHLPAGTVRRNLLDAQRDKFYTQIQSYSLAIVDGITSSAEQPSYVALTRSVRTHSDGYNYALEVAARQERNCVYYFINMQ
jgi:hypothetical protein